MAKAIKKLLRPKEGRMVGGVSLALANYFDVDVTIVRLVWVFLLIPGGLPGLLPYLVMWIVVPQE